MADTAFEPEVSISIRRLSEALTHISCPRGLAFECKKVSATPSLSFEAVKEHQTAGLLEAEQAPYTMKMRVGSAVGGPSRFQQDTPFDFLLMPHADAYILVNFRFTKKAPRKDLKVGTNVCYAIPIHWYIDTKQQLLSLGKKSMDIVLLDNAAKLEHSCVVKLERVRYETGVDSKGKKRYQYGWDLLPLVKGWFDE